MTIKNCYCSPISFFIILGFFFLCQYLSRGFTRHVNYYHGQSRLAKFVILVTGWLVTERVNVSHRAVWGILKSALNIICQMTAQLSDHSGKLRYGCWCETLRNGRIQLFLAFISLPLLFPAVGCQTKREIDHWHWTSPKSYFRFRVTAVSVSEPWAKKSSPTLLWDSDSETFRHFVLIDAIHYIARISQAVIRTAYHSRTHSSFSGGMLCKFQSSHENSNADFLLLWRHSRAIWGCFRCNIVGSKETVKIVLRSYNQLSISGVLNDQA